MTDHERWVSLVTADARGEELTADEREFVASWSGAEDDDDVEGSTWRAIGRLGDDPLGGERSDADLVRAVLSAAVDLETNDVTVTAKSPPTASVGEPRGRPRTSTMHPGSGRNDGGRRRALDRRALTQFVSGFGGVLGAAALAIVAWSTFYEPAATRSDTTDPASQAPRIAVSTASGTTTASMASATRGISPRDGVPTVAGASDEDDPNLGCVELGSGARACPISDDAQLEVGAPLGDRLALSLTAGHLRVSAAATSVAEPRGSLIDTPLGTLDADGRASFEARLTGEPQVLVLIVTAGNVEVVELDGTTHVVDAGHTEVLRAPSPSRVHKAQKPSADAMLGQAQALLVEGEEQAAIKAYRSLLAAHRGTPEARAATLTLARLELDRGHAKRAVALFDRYLSGASGGKGGTSGALGETALVGKIEALRRLNDTAAELEAIEQFLASHGGSVYASSLRDRKATLAAQR